MKRKVKVDVLRRLVHRNMYSKSTVYDEENTIACAEAMAAHGWELPVWVTLNQIENKNGNYAFKGVQLLKGERPEVTITKSDHQSGALVLTEVYNIDQTNFKKVAPGAYTLFKQGKSFVEVSDSLMTQPLLSRAMLTGLQTPLHFFKRIAAFV